MGFGSAPTPPSPSQGIQLGQQVAGQQQQYNIGAQAGSNYNQSNPFGSIGYTQTGTGPNGVPIYTANVSMDPTQQGLFNALMGTKGTAGQQAGSLLSGANYGGQSPTQAVGNEAFGLEGQMEAGYQQEMQPIQQTQRTQLDTTLRNQGLQPGEPGYDNAMRSYDTNVNNANALAASNYAQTAFNQANTLYQEPMAMSESLANFGSYTLPNASAVSGAALQPANLTGAVANEQQALQDQYKAQMDQYSGMMNGIFGIGADALGVMAAPFTGGASLMLPAMMSGMGGGQPHVGPMGEPQF